MPTKPGIDVEDLASIERDQFVYFMTMEYELNDPADWPRFREGLIDALAVAYGWDPGSGDWSQRRQRAGQVLEGARETADPSSEWHRFRDGVWEAVRLPKVR